MKILKNNEVQVLDTIIKVTDSWYEVLWQPELTYPTGSYNFELDLSKIVDKAGNYGTGVENKAWTVERTPNVIIANLKINPDLGFSAIDGITTGFKPRCLF